MLLLNIMNIGSVGVDKQALVRVVLAESALVSVAQTP